MPETCSCRQVSFRVDPGADCYCIRECSCIAEPIAYIAPSLYPTLSLAWADNRRWDVGAG